MAVRVGDKIRVLKDDVAGGYERGNVFTVTRVTGSGDVYFNDNDGDQRFIDDRFYEAAELVTDEPDRLEALEATVKSLTERITQMDTQLRVAREDIVLLEEALSGEVDVLTERVAALESKRSYVRDVPHVSRWTEETKTHGEPMTAPLTRADVVEQAKQDVEELLKTERDEVPTIGSPFTTEPFFPGEDDEVDFKIDRKKRTVVALIRYTNSKYVWARGVSRCATDDCFNVHIGKAIALRRALGLEIPSEYVNAPKPTEAQHGDVVDTNSTILGIAMINNRIRDFMVRPNRLTSSLFKELTGTRILDDSHDFGGQER